MDAAVWSSVFKMSRNTDPCAAKYSFSRSLVTRFPIVFKERARACVCVKERSREVERERERERKREKVERSREVEKRRLSGVVFWFDGNC